MNKNKNQWERNIFLKAWNFAGLHHSGQKYGGHKKDLYIDYLSHIGMVSMEIIWALENSDENYNANLAIQCCILHDTVEDTQVTYNDLLNEFGEEVAKGVLALTKNKDLGSKKFQMEDSLSRIKLQPKEVWMVKMADRISNLDGAPFYWDQQKIVNYKNEGQLIYDSLSSANLILAERLKERINNYVTLNIR